MKINHLSLWRVPLTRRNRGILYCAGTKPCEKVYFAKDLMISEPRDSIKRKKESKPC